MKMPIKNGTKVRIPVVKKFDVCFTNDVGGTSEYPIGSVIEGTVSKSWDDYECGWRFTGIDKNGKEFYFSEFCSEIGII